MKHRKTKSARKAKAKPAHQLGTLQTFTLLFVANIAAAALQAANDTLQRGR